jgi:hypothetical protein
LQTYYQGYTNFNINLYKNYYCYENNKWRCVAGRPRGGEDTASELKQTIALTKPAGRPRRAHTHRAREKKKQFHPGAEDNLPEQDLTILRLGAKGHFNLEFDSQGRLILP